MDSTDNVSNKHRFGAAHVYAQLGIPVFPVNRIVSTKDGSLECECESWRRKKAKLNNEPHAPCNTPGKHPKPRSWKTAATVEPSQIDFWLKEWPDSNIGAVTGNGLFVLDIDGAEGEAALASLVAEHGELPLTPTTRTGSGGWHYWFRMPDGVEVRNSASKVGPKIDIRGEGGYVVAPPSNHKSGGIYCFVEGRAIDEIDIAVSPKWLIDLANADLGPTSLSPDERKGAKTVSVPARSNLSGSGFEYHLSLIGDGDGQQGFDAPINRSALAYIAEHGADANLSKLKDRLRDTIASAYEDPAKPRKEARYLTEEYLDSRIEQARAHIANNPSQREQATGDGAHVFRSRSQIVDVINEVMGFALQGSKGVYIYDDGNGTKLLNKQAAQDVLAPYKLSVGSDDTKSGFDVWLGSPKRRAYSDILFEPGKETPGVYNLWKGFAVEPNSGSCELFLKLVFDVICGGNPVHYEWLMAWLADCVQNPGKKPGTAVVIRGPKGTGKSSFASWISAIFGRHAKTIASSRHLTGNFNGHLADTIILHVDEGFWAGDKAGEAALKQLITDRNMMLERKGVDAIAAPNHVRIIITTNDSWAVPASHDERRFFVLDVSNAHAKDVAYFSALNRELENGGAGALLRELLAMDLSNVDLRNPPKTKALVEQILHTLRPLDEWWHSVIAEGGFSSLNGLDDVVPDGWPHGYGEIDKALVHESYRAFVAGPRGRPVADSVIGRNIRECVPDLTDRRVAVRGGGRSRRYVFPPLTTLRDRFTATYGVAFSDDVMSGIERLISAAPTVDRLQGPTLVRH